MSEELKPCPFCGKEGWLFKHESAYTTEYSVRCEEGCTEIGDEYEEEAIAAWNTRQPKEAASPVERKMIVEWLRARQSPVAQPLAGILARAIERGDHLPSESEK